jgi:hypothetical protein
LTERERALAILNKEKPDQVPWFADLSYWVHYLQESGKIPEEYKGGGYFKMHRDLGVGFYLQGWMPLKVAYEGVEIRQEVHSNITCTNIITPVGTVQQVTKKLPESYTIAIQEHYIKTVDDLKVIRYWYEYTRYEPDYDAVLRRYSLVGDNGLVLCYLPRSPLMQMVVELAGIENTIFAMLDEPEEFEATMDVLLQKADEAAGLVVNSPAECLMIPENLSSEVVGKNLFHKYMEEYEEKWNRMIKRAGKHSFVHMDGTMRGLIKDVAATGFSVLEALTPEPVGDISIEDLHNWVDEDTVIWGGLPGIYFTDLVDDSEFEDFVIMVLDVMKTKPRYVLGVADQVPPGARWERIKRVRDIVDKHGIYV